jgi:hypothetical protein
MPRKSKTGLVYTASERGKELFSCDIECMQCAGHNVDGRRCSRRSCIGTPFCWTHAQQLVGVQVKTFPGMGKGLMVVRKGRGKQQDTKDARPVVFKKGEFIMPYVGEVLSDEEYEARYVRQSEDSLAEYVIEDGAGRHVDAACRRRLPGIANTVVSKKEKAEPKFAAVDGRPIKYVVSTLTGTNSKFTVRTKAHDWHGIPVPAKSAWIVATRPIREGDQLLTYYGKDYRVYTTPGYQETSTTRKRLRAAR